MTALARRTIVTSIAGLPLAAILADPRLAAMAAETLETVSVTTPGGRKVEAALAVRPRHRRHRCCWSTNGGASTTKSRRWRRNRQGGLPRPRRRSLMKASGDRSDDGADLMKGVNPAKAIETLDVWSRG